MHKLPGKIVFVNPLLRPGSGEYEVFAEVKNKKQNNSWILRPNEVVVMTIEVDLKSRTICHSERFQELSLLEPFRIFS